MTRPRKVTLSVKEFSHLVSESLDVANSPSQSLLNKTSVVSDNCEKPRTSSFHRIFSRPLSTPGPLGENLLEEVTETPRKMGITWPFSRSPRKVWSASGQVSGTDVTSAPYHSSANSVVSLAGASTSSLGSLVPSHERRFQDVDALFSDEASTNRHSFKLGDTSPITIAHPHATPTSSGHYVAVPRPPIHAIFRSKSTSVLANTNDCMIDPIMDISREGTVKSSRESIQTAQTLTASEGEFSDDDPTPRATSFGTRFTVSPAVVHSDWTLARRKRSQCLSLVLPPRHCNTFSLRPAVGVTPHVPSDADSSVAASLMSSPTSPRPHTSSVASMSTRSLVSVASQSHVSLPLPTSATLSEMVATPNSASVTSLGSYPWGRTRGASRSPKSPPSPRPPPTGPLPALPTSSSIPPVPPLPPFLRKKSMSMPQQLPISSPTRPTFAGAAPPTSIAVATPPASPGSLRLPSRLSWFATGRAVIAASSCLPSPPASPPRSLKSAMTLPGSPSNSKKNQPPNHKRPTSIGVLEAADNAQVRRTKSILLLGSRSKSNASLGAKRVQIHADAHADADSPPRKPRRKSSATAISHSVDVASGDLNAQRGSPEILVPRERRHSAPLLSSKPSSVATIFGACADWTLSLPFCIDVPGHKITPVPPPSFAQAELEPEPGVNECQGEDWTLCMPLKVDLGPTRTSESIEESEGRVSECAPPAISDPCVSQRQTQLPTPSPSPPPQTPLSGSRVLNSDDSIPRSASHASLGPHAGGLDMDGGCGKRGSGWDVFGWFDAVEVPVSDVPLVDARRASGTPATVQTRSNESKRSRRYHEAAARNPSQDSMITASTGDSGFYSARSSLFSG
ncbi:hypothetical protein PAXRUDRAFT_231486 [Paxillus rubicundulus Ve08.2h10]|uniref:Uncharacterized protein n=1 Tax=Paxillus rubicundulus Ve08.2h10 TaxID=930991 RepID=A0A0D0D9Q2_9AGAM|nr:hypothetical protein PAXRUDRAFT_231486 [Paxillus rubicundulus Ve08.2h10]